MYQVAIIVPFRHREAQLPIFLKNLILFLRNQSLEFGIFVSEQVREGAGSVVVIHLALHQWDRSSNPATGCMCKWVSQSMLAPAGFLRDLRFPPAFKIGTCLVQFKTPLHPRGMGELLC